MGGGDKALQPLGSATLLDHVIARLRPQCAMLALNANGDPARFAALVDEHNLGGSADRILRALAG